MSDALHIFSLTNVNMPKHERLRVNRVIKAINAAKLNMVEHRMLLVAINQSHLDDDGPTTVSHFIEQLKLNGMAQALYEDRPEISGEDN